MSHDEIPRLRYELTRCEDELARCKEELAQCKKRLAAYVDVDDKSSSQDLTTLLTCGKGLPMETSIDELNDKLFDKEEIWINVWAFAPLEPDEESLQQVVSRLVASDEHGNEQKLEGPALSGKLCYVSPHHQQHRELMNKTLVEVDEILSKGWQQFSILQKQWRAHLKNLRAGNYCPIASRSILFGDAESGLPSTTISGLILPTLISKPDGSRWWGMIFQTLNPKPVTPDMMSTLRDVVAMKHMYASTFVSMLSCNTGQTVWQNSSSMELYGCHVHESFHGHERPQLNLLELIFGQYVGSESSVQSTITSVTSQGGVFRCTVEVTDPTLRSLMCLSQSQEMHLDCQVTQTTDPCSLQKVFVVSQMDVTMTAIAQRELQVTQDQLVAHQEQMDLLIFHQNELIECVGWVSGVAANACLNPQAIQLIDRVRKQLTEATNDKLDRLASGSNDSESRFQLEFGDEVLGEGSYGKVWKGTWGGQIVAIKTMTLPVIRSGEEKRERMALMEAAVSSSLDNPNIVKTHHYSIKPVRHQTSSRQIAQISAFEVHLVLEYCDLGSLRAALNSRILHPGSQPDYIAIIHVAMDVALGMRYLHASNIIHADLKASNILLQSGRECMTAKISDFGLSISKLDPLMSHVSGHFQGTMTHMSPECLLIGKQSFAGDVYSFAITLYELYTAENAFAGIPAAMFGHKVCQEHHRPIFPPGTPIGYRQLAEACWDPLPSARPTFNDVVTALAGLGRDQGEYLDVSFDLSDCQHVGHQGIPQAPPHSLPQQPVPIESKELTTNDRQFWVNLFNGVQM